MHYNERFRWKSSQAIRSNRKIFREQYTIEVVQNKEDNKLIIR